MYPEAGGLVELRPPRLQRARELLRGLGADAHLHRHGRDLGVLRPALPGGLLGAARARARATSSSAIGLVALLAALNVKGTEESARLNLVLAIADLLTQIVLVGDRAGARLRPRPARHPGRPRGRADAGATSRSGSRSGWSPTPGSRRSRTWPRRREDATRTIPRGVGADGARGGRALRAAAGDRALGDAGDPGGRRRVHDRARDRPSPTTRCSGSSRTSGLGAGAHRRARGLRRDPRRGDPADRHERGADRRLAAHLLDGPAPPAAGATAPGPPALQDAVRGDPRLLGGRGGRRCFPGETTFLATIYSFGATLSFTIAHVSVIRMRKRYRWRATRRERRRMEPARQRPRSRGVEVPMTAVLGGLGTFGGVRRRDGARPGDPRHRRRLDGRRDGALRRSTAATRACR